MSFSAKDEKKNKHNPELRGSTPGANMPKSMFYVQKCAFWPISALFDPFDGTTIFFKHKIIFSLLSFCHIEPTCQKLCIYGENCDF